MEFMEDIIKKELNAMRAKKLETTVITLNGLIKKERDPSKVIAYQLRIAGARKEYRQLTGKEYR
jgi:hypothetical protein